MEEYPTLVTLLVDSNAVLDFTLETEIGNILTVTTALATCVSDDLCMSKAVEKDFKKSFKHLEALSP